MEEIGQGLEVKEEQYWGSENTHLGALKTDQKEKNETSESTH